MRSSANAERTSITHLQRSERVVFLRWWRCSAGVPAHARGGALRGSTAYGCFCPCFDGLALATHTQPSSASLATCILKLQALFACTYRKRSRCSTLPTRRKPAIVIFCTRSSVFPSHFFCGSATISWPNDFNVRCASRRYSDQFVPINDKQNTAVSRLSFSSGVLWLAGGAMRGVTGDSTGMGVSHAGARRPTHGHGEMPGATIVSNGYY